MIRGSSFAGHLQPRDQNPGAYDKNSVISMCYIEFCHLLAICPADIRQEGIA